MHILYEKLSRYRPWSLIWIATTVTLTLNAMMNTVYGLIWFNYNWRRTIIMDLLGTVDAFVLSMLMFPALLYISTRLRDSEKEVEEKSVFIKELQEQITLRKKAEEEALRMQKLDSLRVLAGGIAHDLNNLMVAVSGNAELALRELSPGTPAWEYVHGIDRASMKVANLSKQILSFAGKSEVLKEPVFINDIIADTASLLIASVSRKAVLEFDLSEDLPVIDADPQNMQQVVMNLIINASDALSGSKGIIKVSSGKSWLDRAYLEMLDLGKSLPEGEYVFIKVTDTGCGMSPETRAKAFEPFYTTKFTGRGLGLSAVFGIVERHGGGIALESAEGAGATFIIFLPISGGLPEFTGEKVSEKDIRKGAGTVLVVDDEESVLLMTTKMLEKTGYNVLSACDGSEAVDVFRENAGTVCAVIMDLIMPVLRGDEAAREIRKIRHDVPIILLSGYHDLDLEEITGGPGRTEVLEKPCRMDKLLLTLQECIGTEAGNPGGATVQ